mgnify:CR=1 FL=1
MGEPTGHQDQQNDLNTNKEQHKNLNNTKENKDWGFL